MPPRALIYEVTLDVDPAIEAEFDEWLERHVAEMLELPGFEHAELEAEVAEKGAEKGTDLFSAENRSVPFSVPFSTRRMVRYTLRDRAALDEYFERHADRMRQAGIDRFGERFTAERRVLESTPLGDHAQPVLAHCANCGYRLRGQYCARCGQRARLRMITLWELFRDAAEELFQHDSRVWRSFFPLLFRPGFLTNEYLAGRQKRYVPPVRMYLFLSIVFFLLAFVTGPDGDLSMGPSGVRYYSPDEAPAEPAPDEAEAPADENPEAPAAERTDEPPAEWEDIDCEAEIDAGVNTGIGFLDRRLSRETIVRTCERLVDDPRGFGRAVLSNLPTMMFFFLPLLALVLEFLYLGSRRYYSEHLLFAVHFHAFFFLIVTLDILLGMLVQLAGTGERLASISTVAIMFYIPWYLFRGMRNVYDQHFLIRLVKYFFLVIAYFMSLLIMLLITLAVTALTL